MDEHPLHQRIFQVLLLMNRSLYRTLDISLVVLSVERWWQKYSSKMNERKSCQVVAVEDDLEVVLNIREMVGAMAPGVMIVQLVKKQN